MDRTGYFLRKRNSKVYKEKRGLTAILPKIYK